MNTDRDNHLWLQLWRDRQIDFHQEKVNKYLTTFWPTLDLTQGSRVFVPLCGKSLDMTWLAKQGYEVVGVELSPVAVKAFFHENRLKPVKRRVGKFTVWEHGRISILCGDYFSLNKNDLGHIDTVYDRAALTALPEDLRKRYVVQLQLIIPDTSDIFLLTVEDSENSQAAEQGPYVDAEVRSLYAADFEINLAHVDCVSESDPHYPDQPPIRTEYKVYQLSSKTARK